MASSSPASSSVPADFREVFCAHADARGRMTFAQFMELALYHPESGYYRRARPRVGYRPGTDFFTATSSGALFGELVTAACTELLRAAGKDPGAHTFVEIGAEPGTDGVLSGVSHPFRGATVLRIGDSLSFPEESIVFSNELLDAQPCVRSVYRHGRWVETGVELRDHTLVEVELESPPPYCPVRATEGYRFDQPLAATKLAARIATESWRGLFLALDYGKTLRELTEETPGGTIRGYFRHTQTNDLLANPGEQDLTCHVCWDWISDALRQHGFAEPVLNFQETFFVRHAGPFIASLSAAEATRFSPRKLALMQLLHPAHLGQKFQVLHALR
jgi:SAM-dependent MidA family methyltransferase